MKLFKWMPGRQPNGKYEFFTIIWSRLLNMDCYIIRFPKGSKSKPHYDRSDFRNHYRLNIILKKAKKGGKFKCDNVIFALFDRIFFFRPDLNLHSVSEIEEGCRYVLSIGKTFRKKFEPRKVYRAESCVNCNKILDIQEKYYRDGICHNCGHNSKGLVCKTNPVYYRIEEVQSRKWYKRNHRIKVFV